MKEFYEWFVKVLTKPPDHLYRFPSYSEETAEKASLFLKANRSLAPINGLGIYHRHIWSQLKRQLKGEYPTLTKLRTPPVFESEMAE